MSIRKNMGKISLILSTYKSDEYLKKFFESIKQASQYLELELVHIPNNPSQNEISEINHFKNEVFSKNSISYVVQIVERESLYSSWNRALNLISNDVVGICNVDDIRYGFGLVKQLKLFKSNSKLLISCGDYWVCRTHRKEYLSCEGLLSEDLLISGMMIGPFFVWRHSQKFRGYSLKFDEQFRVAGDFDFQIRASRLGDVKSLNSPIGEYLYIGKGLSTSGIMQQIETQIVYRRYNIVDKIIPLPNWIFKKYYLRILHLKVDKDWFPVQEICCEYNEIIKINGFRKVSLMFKFLKWFYSIRIIVKSFQYKPL